MSNEFDNVEVYEEGEVEEFESGKDYSTALGIGVIAVGGALAYEGVKQVGKFGKLVYAKAKDKVTAYKSAKVETPDSPEPEESTEDVK